MSPSSPRSAAETWSDALTAAALVAVDPLHLGGIAVRGWAGPVRVQWLDALESLLPRDTVTLRMPVHSREDTLLGGLDLTSALTAGKIVHREGLLTRADRSLLVVPMAERLESGTVALLTRALDEGCVRVEREGASLTRPARFAVIALDESAGPDEQCAPALLDRLGFLVDLHDIRAEETGRSPISRADVDRARSTIAGTSVPDELVDGLCSAAWKLGITSLRAPLLAMRAACAAAALFGTGTVEPVHAQIAARLVLGPRGCAPPEGQPPPPEHHQPDDQQDTADEAPRAEPPDPTTLDELTEILVAAARAALPGDLDALLARAATTRLRGSSGRAGRRGPVQNARDRGRQVGSAAGRRADGRRLDLLATLRAAAPWQRARSVACGRSRQLHLTPDDLRFKRLKQHAAMVTIFCVDASGSAAAQRLAEAKGAVELLLADCYLRRDEAALVTFRDRGAEVTLAPTRSLVRAKRQLAGVVGGGATPLAAGLTTAGGLAVQVLRRGSIPCLVLLTDGRANIALDGDADRRRAHEDTLDAARRVAQLNLRSLLLDTSPRGSGGAAEIAAAMGATCLRLPHADARSVSARVRAFAGG